MKTLFSANIVSELEIRERMARFYHKSSSEAREETKTTDMWQIFFPQQFSFATKSTSSLCFMSFSNYIIENSKQRAAHAVQGLCWANI